MPSWYDFVRDPARRRWLAASAAALVWSVGLGGCSTTAETPPFVAAWTASQQDHREASVLPGRPQPVERVLDQQTLRQVVRVSIGGDAVRVRLSNRFGKEPVTFDSVRVAQAIAVSTIDTGTDLPVTVNGEARITVGPGAEVWSDAAPLVLPDHALVAVTFQFNGPAAVSTQHTLARQTAYLVAGQAASAKTFAYPEFLSSYHWLSAVDVAPFNTPKVIVAFGDSLTDGFASTPDHSRRYPDLLDNRLKAIGSRTSVVNAGISGNRWLNDTIGPSGRSRFERDVLGVTGVTHTLILLGINDIGFSSFVPGQVASAEQIIGALDAAITKARARGIKVLVGTLLPFRGAAYFSEAGEAKRQAVNAWIRGSAQADGVVDFDKAVRDPAKPSQLFPAYDSGDHLHPNDDGYAAMANAVDLAPLR